MPRDLLADIGNNHGPIDLFEKHGVTTKSGQPNTLMDIINNKSKNKLPGYDLMFPNSEGGKVATELLSSFMFPAVRAEMLIPNAGKAAKYAANLLGSATQNAGIGGSLGVLNSDSSDDMLGNFGKGAALGALGTFIAHPLTALVGHGNPLVRLGAAGALGAGTTAGIGAALSHHSSAADIAGGLLTAGLALRGGNARDLALKNILSHVNPEEAVPRAEAAERLNLTIKPEEADPNAYLGHASGKLGKTSQGAEQLFNFDQMRSQEERNAIGNLLDTIYDKSPESAQKIRNLYGQAYQWNIKPEILQKMKQDELIQEAFKHVENTPAFRKDLIDTPQNNYKYLDMVKRALADMEKGAMKNNKASDESRIITGTRKEFENALDQSNPSYKQARAEAQKSIVRGELERKLRTTGGRGTDFARKFLNNEDKFNDLVRSLSNVPEAQQQVRDMKIVFPHLINENSARSAYKLQQNNMPQARNTKNALFDFLHSLQGAKYDNAAIGLTRSRNWVDELKNLGRLQGVPHRTLSIADRLAKALTIGATESAND